MFCYAGGKEGAFCKKPPPFPPRPPFLPQKLLPGRMKGICTASASPRTPVPRRQEKRPLAYRHVFRKKSEAQVPQTISRLSGSCCGSGRDKLATDRTRPCVWSAFPLKKAERRSAARQKSSGKPRFFRENASPYGLGPEAFQTENALGSVVKLKSMLYSLHLQ